MVLKGMLATVLALLCVVVLASYAAEETTQHRQHLQEAQKKEEEKEEEEEGALSRLFFTDINNQIEVVGSVGILLVGLLLFFTLTAIVGAALAGRKRKAFGEYATASAASEAFPSLSYAIAKASEDSYGVLRSLEDGVKKFL